MSCRILYPADVAQMIGCSAETARRIMRGDMPLVNTSPAGTKRPRYGVTLEDLERWMQKRTAYRPEIKTPRDTRRPSDEWPLLQYRKTKGGA